MEKVLIQSGSGYNNLLSVAEAVTNQLKDDAYGTQYEMQVTINAPHWALSASISLANRYVKSHGAKPWPGYSGVVSIDSNNPKVVLFRWIK